MQEREQRRPGRPKAADPMTPVCSWVPTRLYDRLAREATRRDESLSSYVRKLLEHRADSVA